MSALVKVVLGAVSGFVVGVCAVFLGCVAVGAVALSLGSRVELPGLFWAAATQQNGAAAVTFQPRGMGMLVVLIVAALIGMAVAARRTSASAR